MIYLLLAVFSSTAVSILMRISAKYCPNKTSLMMTNYAACAVCGYLNSGSIQLFPPAEGLPFALALGAAAGILYLTSFLLLQWNISHNGVVLASSFIKLGVLVPAVLSITVFHESPQPLQLIGILLSLTAIILMQEGGRAQKQSSLALILLLLTGGGSNAMSKVFEAYGSPALSGQFLMYIFLFALLIAAVMCIVQRKPVSLREILWGIVIGIPNYYCSRFLLFSLSDVPSFIAYPVYSVGGIILVTLVGILCFHETLSKRKLLSMGIIAASLLLLNIK